MRSAAAFVARPFRDWQDGARIVVRVAWDDGAEQRATLEIDAPTVRERAAFGLIKWHLMELGRTLLTANSVRARAWGGEVRHRLVQDRSDPDAGRPRMPRGATRCASCRPTTAHHRPRSRR
jgi:hypothetical protein